MRHIPIEPPPNIEDPILREWLAKLNFQINAALDQVHYMDPVGELPDHIQEGMMVFFNAAIPTTPITKAGPWIVINGTWTAMT